MTITDELLKIKKFDDDTIKKLIELMTQSYKSGFYSGTELQKNVQRYEYDAGLDDGYDDGYEDGYDDCFDQRDIIN